MEWGFMLLSVLGVVVGQTWRVQQMDAMVTDEEEVQQWLAVLLAADV